MTTHTVTFQRNTQTGKWRAYCTCGWAEFGDEKMVKDLAAAHDVIWETVVPECPPTVPK